MTAPGFKHTHCSACSKALKARRDWSPSGGGRLRWAGHVKGCRRHGGPPDRTPAS